MDQATVRSNVVVQLDSMACSVAVHPDTREVVCGDEEGVLRLMDV